MKIISNKSYEALMGQVNDLQLQVKGFSDRANNTENAVFKALSQYYKGIAMAPMVPMSRAEIKDCYKTCGPLYGIVNYIANNVGEVSRYLELYRKADGDIVEEHEVLDLINHPNDRFNRAKYVKSWAVNYLLYDDAWQYIHETVGADRKKELYLIPSDLVIVDKDEITMPFKDIRLIGGKSISIEMEKIVESFGVQLDIDSPFGTSKAVAAGQYLNILKTSAQRQATAMKNGGAANLIAPSAKAAEEGIRPSDRKEIEQRANDINNANKSLSVNAPIEVHQLGNSPTDLGIVEAHKDAVTALCFAYQIPVDLYYGQAKYENAKEAKKTIYEQNAIPMAEEFGNDLLRALGLDDEFEFKVNTDEIDVLQSSPGDVLDNLGKMHATLNELREAYGYDRIEEEWADKPILPLGIQFGNEVADIDISEE